ncbi:prepilin peptidase, partial [Cribrihabitans sp. XS_ASV171]
MAIPAQLALWFLPFVLPLCFYVAFTDMREMRITNQSVILLGAIFVLIAPFLLPLPVYGWQLAQLLIVLVAGIVLNAGGAIGAGDAKFAAAAAPYVFQPDIGILVMIFAANLLAAFTTH